MEQKRGEEKQRFSEGGQAGSRGGCLKKEGGLEPPYELSIEMQISQNDKYFVVFGPAFLALVSPKLEESKVGSG